MKFKKIKNFLPALLFLVFILIIGLYFCYSPQKDYSENEKRYLEKFPKFTVDTLISGEFGEEFETYLADQIANRDFFVGLNAYYDVASGRNGSKGVYLSENGYLINDPVDKDNYLKLNIDNLNKFSKENKLDSTLLIVPSTGYIMNDLLPKNHNAYNDDKYFDIIEDSAKGLNFINIKNIFKEKAKETQLYYKTDHHWTTNGAYIAYEQYCKSKGIKATEKSGFNIKKYDDFYGTTYSTSALWLTKSDDIEIWENKNLKDSDISVEIEEGNKTTKSNSLYYLKHLEENDKYPIFLDGNHSLVRIKNKASKNGKLLVIKDSYAHCFVPFLVEHYSEIIEVDMRYYKEEVSKIVKAEGIKEVLMLYGIDNISIDTDLRWLK